MLYCALIFHCQKNCEVGLLCVLQFVTDKYIEQLRILEKAINQHNEGSLDAKYMVYDDITEKPDMSYKQVMRNIYLDILLRAYHEELKWLR